MTFRSLITAVLLSLYSISAHVQAAKLPEPVHQVEGISEYQLDNGLKVLLFPDPTKETVTVNVTYKVGSKHENYGETGMAHLLEHLLFKGSEKHKDIPAELSAHGARPNGTTWIDRTNYFETFSATEENIDWALSLESDRMVNSFIAKEDLDSEMTVVRNEFERTENSPFRVLMQSVMNTAYDWHNNGKPTIGARSDIENVAIENLQAFYKKYYQPDNAVLIVAGKFDPQTILKKINNTFGKIKKPKRNLPKLYTEEPAQDGEKSVTVRRVGDEQWYASAYHIPAGTHPDYAALEVLSHILGDTPRGRLHKQVVETNKAVSAFAYPFQLQSPGLMFFAAQADMETDLSTTRQAVIDVIENIEQNPITEEELETAKRSIMKSYDQAFNSSEQIAILLSEYIGMGDWRMLFLTRDRVEQTTVAEVQQAASKYLVRNNRTDGTFIPTKNPQRVEIPKADSVSAMLEGYTGREAVALGEAFEPSFENIKARAKLTTLNNGAEVSLLPKKTRGEKVVIHFSLRFGNEQNLKGQRLAGDLTGSMMMRGTSKYSREQLQSEFDKLKTTVSLNGNATSAVGSLTTEKQYVVPALELLAHVLKDPAFPQNEFDLMINESVASLEASRQEPQAVVSREMRQFYNHFDKSHPYYSPTLDEQLAELKKANISELKSFHKNYYGSNHMQLAVVGDFERDPVMSTLNKEFGQWNSPSAYQRILHRYEANETINKTVQTPDKENAAIITMLELPVGEQDKAAPELDMAVYMLGGGFLNSRLATRLRQQDGLSYGVGAWINMDPTVSKSALNAYAIYAPQNAQKVEQALKEEIAKVLSDGFTEDELQQAKSGYLQKARVNRSDDNNIAGLLNSSRYLERDILWGARYEADIEGLTTRDIQAALNKYITLDQFSFVKAGDFDNK